jgi:hypothetical protein
MHAGRSRLQGWPATRDSGTTALSFSMSNLFLKSEGRKSAHLCKVPSRMCFASKNSESGMWGRETISGIEARLLFCKLPRRMISCVKEMRLAILSLCLHSLSCSRGGKSGHTSVIQPNSWECGSTGQGPLSELSSKAWGTLVHGSDRPISPK